MFDKNNTGEIGIGGVYDLIKEFDKRESEDWKVGESKDDPLSWEEAKDAPA